MSSGVAWADLLTDTAIARAVGHEAFARGFVYARTGHVLHLELDESELAIHALVSGSSREPYRTRVYLKTTPAGSAGRHEAFCDCPITVDCKHAAAVMLATRTRLAGQAPPSRPSWERTLGRVLGGPAINSGSAATPVATALGLQVDFGRPAGRPGLTLLARPVREGRKGRWVQTGVGWGDLAYDYGHRYDAAQRDWLLRLQSTTQTVRSGGGWTNAGATLNLSAAGPALWPLLAEAAGTGLSLVLGGRSTGFVRLAAEPAELDLDLTVQGDGWQLVPRVVVEGEPVGPDELALVGEPAHGVMALRGTILRGTSRESELVAARLPEPLTRELHDWLARGEPVQVPDADRDRFVDDFLPGLRQRCPLGSSDGSVRLPDAPRPVLQLRVDHGDATAGRLGLTWSVGYPRSAVSEQAAEQSSLLGPALRIFPLARPGPVAPVRDLAAEDALLAALPLPYGRLPVLADPQHPGRPRAEVSLTGLDAARFCSEVVPELVASGVTVVETGEPVDYRVLDAPPLITVSALDRPGAADWFDLVVDVSIDGELVPFEPLFAALVAGADHLVLDTGVYVDLDRPELHRLLELIVEARALQDRDRTGLRLNRRHLALWQELVELGVVDRQSTRWLENAQRLRELEPEERPDPPEPPGLQAELRPYQQDGYGWLWSLWRAGVGGILADDMGLGKTVQALALVTSIRAEAATADGPAPPVLVVAPTSVLATWADEAARFVPHLEVVTVERTTAKHAASLAERVAGADLVLTSYAVLRIDVDHWEALDWQALVLDEAQFVKNHQAKTYAAVRRLGVDFALAMTGTPLENSLMDLWAMLSITAPGMFPSPQRFASYYARPVERGDEPGRLLQLRHRIRPLMLRRTKEVVADELPPKQEQVLPVPLHPRHARIYQTHLQRERQKVLGLVRSDLAADESEEHRFTVLRSLTLLRQLSLDPALVDRDYDDVPAAKLDLLVARLTEVTAEGHRALVFSQFTRFLRRLEARLVPAGVPVSYLDGSTRDRRGAVQGFRDGPPGAFLISLKAGGFGLNLTEADYCFVCDPWWNPAAEAQAVDRAHRIGQTRPVLVYRLVAADTIEEKVMALKERKQRLYDSVVGGRAPAGSGATLSTADLVDLLDG